VNYFNADAENGSADKGEVNADAENGSADKGEGFVARAQFDF